MEIQLRDSIVPGGERCPYWTLTALKKNYMQELTWAHRAPEQQQTCRKTAGRRPVQLNQAKQSHPASSRSGCTSPPEQQQQDLLAQARAWPAGRHGRQGGTAGREAPPAGILRRSNARSPLQALAHYRRRVMTVLTPHTSATAAPPSNTASCSSSLTQATRTTASGLSSRAEHPSVTDFQNAVSASITTLAATRQPASDNVLVLGVQGAGKSEAVSALMNHFMRPADPVNQANTPLLPELGTPAFLEQHTWRSIEPSDEIDALYDDNEMLPTFEVVDRKHRFYDPDENRRDPRASAMVPVRLNGDSTKAKTIVRLDPDATDISIQIGIKQYERVGAVMRKPRELELMEQADTDHPAGEDQEAER